MARASKKTIQMKDRVYQGAQWDDVLEANTPYELPADFADWLVAGDFAIEIKTMPKAKDGEDEAD